MHELALTESMLALCLDAAEKQGAKRILQINLRLGALSGVMPDCVRYYFELQSQNTPAQGARLEMETVPLTIRCRACGAESRSQSILLACPACGSEDFQLLSGQEYYVDSLEAE